MGCVSSKRARSPSPVRNSTATSNVRHHGSEVDFDSSLSKRSGGGFGDLEKIKEEPEKENEEESVGNSARELKNSKSSKKGGSEKKAVFSLRLGRYTEGEQISAGWPPWLSAVAGEAVHGWLPLRADLYEKLDKVGQGTYSSVYRARDVETGRLVALKKVRFDNFQPESVRFMAREITILRQLDHPNIMKLEGLITNRFSCSIYLVFEYMEHDLSGLLSCPDINFSDAQIKCYMRQLLAGLEHCHLQGVMHRDIKTANILINNEGILKIADFGLANYISSRHRRPLTSRVVTLWYRPPELLLGSTNYDSSVDLWSVGCVFAELFTGKPILKGRTEVEQLHKIFKLCGSPPDEYWRKSKLPLATIFKPQYPYLSSLRERYKELPKSAVNLLETFLSIEPHKRGTASSALNAEYFSTKPYACDPSSLPKYKPYKELDAKVLEEMQRRKVGVRARVSGTSRNPRRARRASQEEFEATTRFARRNKGGNTFVLKAKGTTESRESLYSSHDAVSEASQASEASQVDSFRSVPVVTASTNFAWAKKQKGYAAVSTRFQRQANSRSQSQSFSSLDPSSILQASYTLDSDEHENDRSSSKVHINSGGSELYGVPKHALRQKNWRLQRPDSFDASDLYHSVDFSSDSSDQKRIQLSGPRTHRLGGDQENHIRQAIRRSQLHRG